MNATLVHIGLDGDRRWLPFLDCPLKFVQQSNPTSVRRGRPLLAEN